MVDRIQSLQFRCAEDGHQNRLRRHAVIRAVLLAASAPQHRLTHLLLRMIIVGAYPFIIQEGEQLISVRFQALAQANAVLVGIDLQPEAVESGVKQLFPLFKLTGWEFLFLFP